MYTYVIEVLISARHITNVNYFVVSTDTNVDALGPVPLLAQVRHQPAG